jgi:hypothetical protein
MRTTRIMWAALIALLLCLTSTTAEAQQTASRVFTVTVQPSPLLADVKSGCTFVVERGSNVADCTATIRVAQPTLETRGWRLGLSVSGLINQATGASLPASAVAILAGGAVSATAGQSIDAAGGPHLPAQTINASLDQSRPVVVAEPGFGNGAYTVTIRLRLTLPEGAEAGTYVPGWSIDVANGLF